MHVNLNSLKQFGELDIQLNNSHFKKSLTANLLKKIAVTIGVSIILFIILFVYSYEVYHQYVWQEYDLVYNLVITMEILWLRLDIGTLEYRCTYFKSMDNIHAFNLDRNVNLIYIYLQLSFFGFDIENHYNI